VVAAPRLVIAAPGSGQGKTTVATGLLAAFAARGVRVAGFKVGPDYIDPGYHALASGRPGRNLDPVLVGEGLVGPLFRHGSAGAELSIVEGVMGLYDGRTGSGTVTGVEAAEAVHCLAGPARDRYWRARRRRFCGPRGDGRSGFVLAAVRCGGRGD
jgi:cobyrinic acid a,c-diamide synthase